MSPRFSLAVLGLAALGACATRPPEGPPMPTAADAHRITVEQSGDRMDIVVSPSDVALSDKARSDLRDFAGGYLRAGHGAMIMSTPSGGDNANSAGLMAQQTRLALVEAGIPYSAIAGSTYDASGGDGAPIILTYTRFEARAPECAPLWSQDLGHQMNNQPWASFGCATQANLAAMIEDPHDLVDPRAMDARDSGRRNVVMDAYRRGERTHAPRSTDERVTVSTVANN